MQTSDLVDAVVGKGIHFDGTDAEITFTNDFSGTASSTMSAWVNQQRDTDGSSDTIVSFGSANNGETRFFYSAHASTNNVVGGFFNDDVDSNSSIRKRGLAATSLGSGMAPTVGST